MRAVDINPVIDLSTVRSFGVARNPFDRILSAYNFLNARLQPSDTNYYKLGLNHYIELDFKTWLLKAETWMPFDVNKTWKPDQKMQSYDWLTIDGEIAVRKVIRFEHLVKEFKELLEEWNLLGRFSIPHNNANPPTKTKYDNEMLDFMYEHFADDMRVFGYTYENSRTFKGN